MDPISSEHGLDDARRENDILPSGTVDAGETEFVQQELVDPYPAVAPKPKEGYDDISSKHASLKFEEQTRLPPQPTSRTSLRHAQGDVTDDETHSNSVVESIVSALEENPDAAAKAVSLLLQRDRERKSQSQLAKRAVVSHQTWYSTVYRIFTAVAVVILVSATLQAFVKCLRDRLPTKSLGSVKGDTSLSHTSPGVFHFGENAGFRPRNTQSRWRRRGYAKTNNPETDIQYTESNLDLIYGIVESVKSLCSESAVADVISKDKEVQKQQEDMWNYYAKNFALVPWRLMDQVETMMPNPIMQHFTNFSLFLPTPIPYLEEVGSSILSSQGILASLFDEAPTLSSSDVNTTEASPPGTGGD